MTDTDVVFFVYLDWTLEDISRVYYVGKGTKERVERRERNSDWKKIAEMFGWRRELVMSTRDEDYAYAIEKELVMFHNTFHGWGANLNEGGRGQRSGWRHTQITRMKISDTLTGHPSWSKGKRNSTAGPKISAKLKGRDQTPTARENMRRAAQLRRGPMSDVAKLRMRAAKLGTPLAENHRIAISLALKGHAVSKKTREKIRFHQPHRRTVRQLTLDGTSIATYPSIKDAVRKTGVINVGLCCRGVRTSAGGFRWSYEENIDV